MKHVVTIASFFAEEVMIENGQTVLEVKSGGDLIQIAKQAGTEEWAVSNAMNGHGHNCFEDYKNATVVVAPKKERSNQLHIEFNNTEFANERALVDDLTLDEEVAVIDFINKALIAANKSALLGSVSLDKLQKFVWNYENMSHYRTTTRNNF